MTDLCKHKGAAASINWFVGLLKGKAGPDRREAMAALSKMLHDMKANNCEKCAARGECHELDKAMKALSEREVIQSIASEPSVVGPLTMKRDHARRTRLVRPFGR